MADSSSTFQLSDVSDLTPLSSGPEILVPITRAQTMGPRLPTERIKYTTGNCPKFKDTRAMINDPFNKKVYMFLCDQSDAPAPAAYFYSCDIAAMRWSNLTDHLIHYNLIHYRTLQIDPFDTEQKPRKKRLPRITQPRRALLRIHNSSFIAMLGGYDHDLKDTKANVSIVDPTNKTWWIAEFEGKLRIGPRIAPAMVAVNHNIYIFGGYHAIEGGKKLRPIETFSVAEYDSRKKIWRWAIRDEPYSGCVPSGHLFRVACSLNDHDARILLSPGCLTDLDRIHFTKDNSFFYYPKLKTFYPATQGFTGSFPHDVWWYSVFQAQDWPRRQGLNLMDKTPVFICAWIPVHNTEDLAPEIWQLSFPQKRIDCLHISRKIWDLDTMFEQCVYIDSGSRPLMRMLGTTQASSTAGKKRRRPRSDDDDDDDSDSSIDSSGGSSGGDGATWNAYYDVPLLAH